jgi:hypothetical protein
LTPLSQIKFLDEDLNEVEFSDVFSPIKMEVGYVEDVLVGSSVEGVIVEDRRLRNEGIAFYGMDESYIQLTITKSGIYGARLFNKDFEEKIEDTTVKGNNSIGFQ